MKYLKMIAFLVGLMMICFVGTILTYLLGLSGDHLYFVPFALLLIGYFALCFKQIKLLMIIALLGIFYLLYFYYILPQTHTPWH